MTHNITPNTHSNIKIRTNKNKNTQSLVPQCILGNGLHLATVRTTPTPSLQRSLSSEPCNQKSWDIEGQKAAWSRGSWTSANHRLQCIPKLPVVPQSCPHSIEVNVEAPVSWERTELSPLCFYIALTISNLLTLHTCSSLVHAYIIKPSATSLQSVLFGLHQTQATPHGSVCYKPLFVCLPILPLTTSFAYPLCTLSPSLGFIKHP